MLQLLNEDLVFEDSSSWRLVYDRKSKTLQDSDSGLWQRSVRTLQRIKRGLFDSWFEPVTTTTTTTQDIESTSEQGTSNT